MNRYLACFALLTFGACLLPADIPPVSPDDLSLKKARVDPTADAEVLLWDVRIENQFVNNRYPETTFTYFVRVKLFNEAAIKKYGTVDVVYGPGEHVGQVNGRTIEPDGSVVELSNDAVFDHVMEKNHRKNVHAVSFAMPGLKPGAIAEYHYRRNADQIWTYVPLETQVDGMDIPVEHIVFHIKPFREYWGEEKLHYRPFQTTVPPFKQDVAGFFTSSIENIPASHDEPDSPPDRAIRPWLLIYYTADTKEDPDQFWKKTGKRLYEVDAPKLKVNGDVQRVADEVTAGAKSDDEKLSKLFYYCQKKIKNINSHDVSDVERKDFKPNKNSGETLTRGEGTSEDVMLAFIALASAAGFEARPAWIADRELTIFNKSYMVPYFNVNDAAVRVNGKWRFYDPARRWLGPGEVRWPEEGIEALVADPKDPHFELVPFSNAEYNGKKQTGRLTLKEDGSVEGDLVETFTGQLAIGWRAENFELSPSSREKDFKEAIQRHFPGADVSEIKLSDPADASIPVTLSCHIKMDGFATRTGKRMFFNPAVFQINNESRYSDVNRHNFVVFRYPWTEVEDVSIAYPQGFQLDHPDVAAPLMFNPVGAYKTTAVPLGNRVLFHRELVFGKDGSIVYPDKAYPTLKKIFDSVHDRDAHMLTLKQDMPVAELK